MDLHEEFLKALADKIPKKATLADTVADLLKLEKDAAYRRLSGRVYFSLREAGILAAKLNLSLDRLLREPQGRLWVPITLAHPMRMRSMDSLYELSDAQMSPIARHIERGDPVEAAAIYNTLPMELFMYSPNLTKFMFFKWGYYFVGTEEFDHYTSWELPGNIRKLLLKMGEIYKFEKIYYIWDESLIGNLCREIYNFKMMNIISNEEKEKIISELKSTLYGLEKILNGTGNPNVPLALETDFYVSSLHLGFTSSYFQSGDEYFSLSFKTDFTFSLIEDRRENFENMKNWMDSFRNISVLLSGSGPVERRLFFEKQHRMIDRMLGLPDTHSY